MTITVEVNRNVKGALYHADDLDTALNVAIEGFEPYTKIELVPDFVDILKTVKQTNLRTLQYLKNIEKLTSTPGEESVS